MSTQTATDSPRAVAARLNGAKSKGPKTAEGKARSSRNALKHGLSSERDLVLSIDPQDEFESFQAKFHEDLAPTDQLQTILVERIVACAWRLRRILQIETSLLSNMTKDDRGLELAFFYNGYDAKLLALSRYEATLERGLHKSLNALRALQKRTQEPTEQPTNQASQRSHNANRGPADPEPRTAEPRVSVQQSYNQPISQLDRAAIRSVLAAWPEPKPNPADQAIRQSGHRAISHFSQNEPHNHTNPLRTEVREPDAE